MSYEQDEQRIIDLLRQRALEEGFIAEEVEATLSGGISVNPDTQEVHFSADANHILSQIILCWQQRRGTRNSF